MGSERGESNRCRPNAAGRDFTPSFSAIAADEKGAKFRYSNGDNGNGGDETDDEYEYGDDEYEYEYDENAGASAGDDVGREDEKKVMTVEGKRLTLQYPVRSRASFLVVPASAQLRLHLRLVFRLHLHLVFVSAWGLRPHST